MAQKMKKKNTQIGSGGNRLHDYSAPKSANLLSPRKQTTESKIDESLQWQSCSMSEPAAAAISVGLIDKNSFTRECISTSMREMCKLFDITSFATCDECLQSTRNYDLILYYAHESITRPANEQAEPACVGQALRMAPVVILADFESPDSIIAAFEIGARGYIPTVSTTLGIAIEIVRLVKAGGTFVPPSTLSLAGVRRQGEPS